MRTHYDNLQIPRDADEQTIRQAYRRLSKQYHPDLNPSEDASRIMQLINRAYTVLSDPEQRAEHDRWIQQQETLRIPQQPTLRRQSAPQPQRQPENEHSASNTAASAPKTSKQKLWQPLFIIACCALVALFFWQLNSYLKTQAAEEETHATQPETAGTAPADATQPENEAPAVAAPLPAPANEAAPSNYVRPSTAPNGEPFPNTSGYVKNYPYTRSTTKQLTIFVDNIRNTSDVFAELHQANAPQPLRTFFIEERSQLPLTALEAGSYTIRYVQLDTGETVTSETIALSDSQKEATVYLQRAKE
ncbi:J domain-containing protein [Kingella oralis]|uniref:J domain-containing protein n=1 Tax=Kingella oralis TaxID=505 RepID=UPI0034E56AA8